MRGLREKEEECNSGEEEFLTRNRKAAPKGETALQLQKTSKIRRFGGFPNSGGGKSASTRQGHNI
jgi:hypothetical protein